MSASSTLAEVTGSCTVLKAVKDYKETVSLLNVEVERKYLLRYWAAHQAAGIDVMPMLSKSMLSLMKSRP